MKHENDCRELAQKLVHMKSQMMENDISKSIGRKFGAVKIGLVKQLQMTPVSLEFVQAGSNSNQYYFQIESRQSQLKIDFEAVESVAETKDARLAISYFQTNSDGNGFTKKSETFECFEIHDIIKVFKSIRNIVQAAEAGEDGAHIRL